MLVKGHTRLRAFFFCAGAPTAGVRCCLEFPIARCPHSSSAPSRILVRYETLCALRLPSRSGLCRKAGLAATVLQFVCSLQIAGPVSYTLVHLRSVSPKGRDQTEVRKAETASRRARPNCFFGSMAQCWKFVKAYGKLLDGVLRDAPTQVASCI